jgi:uncharacterized membrane protein YphA (DoxX/SURF4 family)
MSGVTRRRQRSERKGTRPSSKSEESVVGSTLFRLGRVLFGGILAFVALDNLRNLDERIQYAESKGAPNPDVAVPAVSAGLLLGSVGVALWRLPSLAAAAVAWFFVSVTPVMHDFWTLEDPEQKQQQLTHFLKNTALLGAALAFLKLGRRTG